MFEIVRQDLERCVRVNQMKSTDFSAYLREMFNPGTQAILIHRFGVWSDKLSLAPARFFFRVVHFLVQHVVAWRVGIYIPVKADIGPGLAIHTWGGGVFLPSCKIGRDLTIVGGGVLFDYDTLEIGDEVTVGAGTKSTGRIRIGNRVTTGPNSVLIEDVPDDSLVFGNPARVMRKISARRQLAKVSTGTDTASPDSPPVAAEAGAIGGAMPESPAAAASVSSPRLAAF
jgi:serine O-acetyltransferase